MVRHFGVFKFKNTVTEAQISESFKSLKDMVGKIPGLLEMEHGPYNGDEGMNEDFTHGFLMTLTALNQEMLICLIRYMRMSKT